METRSTYFSVLLAVTLLLVLPAPSHATSQINTGWDLLATQQPTNFGGVPFVGVPQGTFNFGGSIGTKGVGNADTIVERLGNATTGAPTIPVELLALHLRSSVPTNFGLGVGFYFVTLQSERGGPATTGQMAINGIAADGGTFNSFFDVFFDIRLGSVNGPIALSQDLVLTGSGIPWGESAPPNAVVIDGVNHLLNGVNTSNDFWPTGTFTETFPTGAQHTVTTATVPTPEPASLLLLAAGAIALASASYRRRRTKIPSAPCSRRSFARDA